MNGFSVVLDAITSFLSRQVDSEYIIDKHKIVILKNYCDCLDEAHKDSDIISITSLINDNRCVVVIYECESLFYWNKSKHLLDELVKRSLNTELNVSNNGNICVKYTFPSCFVEIE